MSAAGPAFVAWLVVLLAYVVNRARPHRRKGDVTWLRRLSAAHRNVAIENQTTLKETS